MLISNRTNIGAGGQNDNLFAGSYIEFMPNDGILQFGFTSSEAFATADNISVDVLCGTDLIASGFNPRATTSQPIYPDGFLLSCPAPAGERIIAKARNKAIAAKDVYWTVMFDRV